MTGDSFALGVVPYSLNYARLIENRLQREFPLPDNRIEVINLGLNAVGPAYGEAKELAISLEPNKEIITPIQMLSLEPICTSWRKDVEDVRTFFRQSYLTLEDYYIPNLTPPPGSVSI